VYRNSNNFKVSTLDQLISILIESGINTDNLDSSQFINDKEHHIVSNKVGANKKARAEAILWIKEIEEKKMIREGKIMTFKEIESLKAH